MKRQHYERSKFHTWYTLGLSLVSILVIVIVPSISLFIVLGFLLLYVGGNGFLHAKAKTLSRDIIFEYALVALVALFVLLGALLNG